MSIQYISFTRQGKGGTVLGGESALAHVLATFIRSLYAQIFGKLICNFSETKTATPSLLVEDSLSANILRRWQIMCK